MFLKPKMTLIALAALAGLTFLPARRLCELQVDTSNQAMSESESSGSVGALSHQTLLIAVSSSEPMDTDQMQGVNQLATNVGQIPQVSGVILPWAQHGPWAMQLLRRVLLGERAAGLDALSDLLKSEDGRVLGMLVILSPKAGSGPGRTEVLAHIQTEIAGDPIPQTQCTLVGFPVVDEAVGEMIRRDQRILLPLSVVVMGLLLVVMFRDITGLLAPMASVGLAVVWTLGIYAWQGNSLNVVTSLLAPVVMILALTTAVHVVDAYRSCRNGATGPGDAAAKALRRVWRPCLFSALTTAAGLGSLACSSTPAVRLFGIYGSLGTLLACVFGLTVIPMLLTLPVLNGTSECPTTSRGLVRAVLKGCYRLGWHQTRQLGRLIGGVSILALIGLARLHSNTNLIDYLPRQSPLVQASLMVDRDLLGVNALECQVTLPASKPVDEISLHTQREQFVQAASGIKGLNGIVPGPGGLDFTFRVRALGSHQAQSLFADLQALGTRYFGPGTSLRFDGDFYRMVRQSSRLVSDLLRSFGLALAIITILIGIQLRSFRATGLALILNILPVLWIFGLMGLTGIDLSVGTAMIACVVLGLAVDYSIHYLSCLKRLRQSCHLRSIRLTTWHVGPALLFSTCILAAGFSVGAAGSFRPTVHFALFTALAMTAALFCNMTILPALIRRVNPFAEHQDG